MKTVMKSSMINISMKKTSMIRVVKTFYILFFMFSVNACSLAMKYEQPELPVPEKFLENTEVLSETLPEKQPETDSISSLSTAEQDKNKNQTKALEKHSLEDWQTFIVDEQLKKLISIALENNRDLRVAALNVEKAKAIYRIEKSDPFPELAVQGNGQHRKTSSNVAGGGATTHEYQVNVGVAAYELDFFARVHNLSKAALQQYLATEEAQRSAQISLIAEVSTYYINYQLTRAELILLKANLVSSDELLSLMEKRAQAGIDKPMQLEQSRMMYQSARLYVLQKQQEQESLKNALQLLLAKPISIEPIDANQQLFMEEVPEGLSSDLLVNRPDIRQAELMLKKANANVGVARANFFPRISLTANTGVASNSLSNLFESDSDAWLFKPEIYIPLFRGGANKSGLKQAKVDQEIAVAQYEKSIQLAFREVVDALQANTLLQEQNQASEKQLQAAQTLYRFAQSRFDQGLDNRMNLLNAYQDFLSAQQQDFLIRKKYSLSRIQLYKALGGGWKAGES